MRFGISATSWIFPKNFRTRLRPVNVCAIVASHSNRAGPGTAGRNRTRGAGPWGSTHSRSDRRVNPDRAIRLPLPSVLASTYPHKTRASLAKHPAAIVAIPGFPPRNREDVTLDNRPKTSLELDLGSRLLELGL